MALVTIALTVLVMRVQLDAGRRDPSAYPTPQIPAQAESAPAPGIVNPADYGAVGDGVTDDTRALQAALDAADGRTVLLADGATYLCSRSLRLPSHTTLQGSRTSVLNFGWEHTSDVDSGGGYYVGNADQTDGNVDIVLEGFSIRGGSDGEPAGPMDPSARNVPAVRLRFVNTFTVRDVDIGFAAGISLLYQGSAHGTIVSNHIHDSGRDGITGTAAGMVLADILVADNLIERVGDDAIAVAGATAREPNSNVLPTDIDIVDNRIAGWESNINGRAGGRGIALLAVTNVRVRDNQIARTAAAGILVRGAPSDESINPLDGQPWYSSKVFIHDNTIERAGAFVEGSTLPEKYTHGNGIEVERAQFVRAQDNEVQADNGEILAIDDCLRCDFGNLP